jgi:hypothetical protein
MAAFNMQILYIALFVAFLYYVTLPGVLITLPSKTDSAMVVNVTHSIVFAAAFVLTYDMFLKQVAKY